MDDTDFKFDTPVTYEQLTNSLIIKYGDNKEFIEEFVIDEVEPTDLNEERGTLNGVFKIQSRYAHYREEN